MLGGHLVLSPLREPIGPIGDGDIGLMQTAPRHLHVMDASGVLLSAGASRLSVCGARG